LFHFPLLLEDHQIIAKIAAGALHHGSGSGTEVERHVRVDPNVA